MNNLESNFQLGIKFMVKFLNHGIDFYPNQFALNLAAEGLSMLMIVGSIETLTWFLIFMLIHINIIVIELNIKKTTISQENNNLLTLETWFQPR